MEEFSTAVGAELNAIGKDRWMFALVSWLPVFVSVFLLLIFSAGQPVNLPVGVVDLDQGSLSRKVVRYLDASSSLNVTRHYTSIAAGKSDLSNASIYALVVIPANLSRDVVRGEAPAISAFFNAQYLLVAKSIRRALIEIETTLAVELDVGRTLISVPVMQAAMATSMPLRNQISALYNSNMNYATFLVPALLAALFQLLIISVTILSLGRQENNPRASISYTELASRSFVYTGLFFIHILLSLVFLYGFLAWPHQLSFVSLLPLILLFVVACQLLGAFFYVLTFDLVRSLSLAGAFSAPAFAFIGVTFPASDMSVFARFWRDLMPAAHYLDGFLNQLSYSAGTGHLLRPGLVLLIFVVLIPVIVQRYKDRSTEEI